MRRGGVVVEYRDGNGDLKKERLRIFDFDNPENNHFLAVGRLWIKGALYRRRADVIGFVNGIPLVFIELKAPNRDLQRAPITKICRTTKIRFRTSSSTMPSSYSAMVSRRDTARSPASTSISANGRGSKRAILASSTWKLSSRGYARRAGCSIFLRISSCSTTV